MRIRVSLIVLLYSAMAMAQVQMERHFEQMGTWFQLVVVDTDSLTANRHLDLAQHELERIENLLSEWREHTPVSEVNRKAGIQPVHVSEELLRLAQQGKRFSHLTQGAFDLTIVAMDRVWKFDGSMTALPSKKAIRQSVALVNYKNLRIDMVNATLFLRKTGMKMGFGSIGKGYAADAVRRYLQNLGVQAGIVNASGDLATWGRQLDGSLWSIGIENPKAGKNTLKTFEFETIGIATSGSYQKFAEIDGKRYSHIINPQTGWPSSGLTSVTVWGPSCEVANGISTSVMAMGLPNGIHLFTHFPDYHYYIVLDNGQTLTSLP